MTSNSPFNPRSFIPAVLALILFTALIIAVSATGPGA